MINKCKHTAKFRIYTFEPDDQYVLDGTYVYNMIRNSMKYKDYSYEELDDDQKKIADEKQLNDSWMRCSEHCGNTVRDK